ncbi:MAG: hypothetical protein LBI60_00655 [Bacteroidales bacterium]|jgi:hypothetical protein|nr:hypothetical protein [Bacteroidales bacterium]
MGLDYIGIIVTAMSVCALFVTLTPIIDRLRDRRIRELERKTKRLLEQLESYEKRLQVQEKSLEITEKWVFSQFGDNNTETKKT